MVVVSYNHLFRSQAHFHCIELFLYNVTIMPVIHEAVVQEVMVDVLLGLQSNALDLGVDHL